MLIYLDTNVFVYALSKNVDDISQKERALEYLRKAIEKDELITSDKGFKNLQKYTDIEITIL